LFSIADAAKFPKLAFKENKQTCGLFLKTVVPPRSASRNIQIGCKIHAMQYKTLIINKSNPFQSRKSVTKRDTAVTEVLHFAAISKQSSRLDMTLDFRYL